MSSWEEWERSARAYAGEMRAEAGSNREYVAQYAAGALTSLNVMVPSVRDQFAVLGTMVEENIVLLPRAMRMKIAREFAELLVRQVRKRLEE